MKKEYLKIPIEIIRDPNLSFEALGLWIWALAEDHGPVLCLNFILTFMRDTADTETIKKCLKELIENGYCIEDVDKCGNNDYVFLEKKVSPSLIEILIEYDVSESHLQAILMYEPDQIVIAVEAVKQWADKKESQGEPLLDLGSAIIKALINKWKPNNYYVYKNPNPHTKP